MRVMKFAVVLGFTAALVALGNYPHPVTVHGAAPRALPQFTDGSGPTSTNSPGLGAICANCHQTINHIAPFDAIEIECEDCHGSGVHSMVGATSAYHTSLAAGGGDCKACHSNGAYGMEGMNSAYHTSFAGPMPMH